MNNIYSAWFLYRVLLKDRAKFNYNYLKHVHHARMYCVTPCGILARTAINHEWFIHYSGKYFVFQNHAACFRYDFPGMLSLSENVVKNRIVLMYTLNHCRNIWMFWSLVICSVSYTNFSTANMILDWLEQNGFITDVLIKDTSIFGASNGIGRYTIFCAIVNCSNRHILKRLLGYIDDSLARYVHQIFNWTYIYDCIEKPLWHIKMLAEYDNVKSNLGKTLKAACEKNKLDHVRWILENAVNIPDNILTESVLAGLENGNQKIVNYILCHAEIDFKTRMKCKMYNIKNVMSHMILPSVIMFNICLILSG